MMKILLIFLSILLGMIFLRSDPVLSKVLLRENYTYYLISGNNGREIMESKAIEAGKANKAVNSDASTEFSLEISDVDYSVTEQGRCVIDDVVIYLNIKYIMPKWKPKGKVSRQVRMAWDRYYAHLKEHENEHVQMVKAYAEDLEKEFKRTTGSVVFGCNDFLPVLRMRVFALKNKLRQKSDAFDRMHRRTSTAERELLGAK